MTQRLSPLLLLTFLFGTGMGLVVARSGDRATTESGGLGDRATTEGRSGDRATTGVAERTVYLAGGVSDENLIVFTAAVAAADPSAMVLLDTPKASPFTKAFLDAYQPKRIIPVGSFAAGIPDLETRLGRKTAPLIPMSQGLPLDLWKELFPQAERVVLTPAKSHGLLLQAACLAGILRVPLLVTRGQAGEDGDLHRLMSDWKTKEVLAAGSADNVARDLPGVHLVPLADSDAVAQAYKSHLLEKGPIRTLVLANPADKDKGKGDMAVLAPWVALHHQAPLLLTNEQGDNAAVLVKGADYPQADSLILVAGLKAILMDRRPNPAQGKDPDIEMEPMTPTGSEPFSFATGRLFQDDLGVAALILARQRLLQDRPVPFPRKALIVSNPNGDLPFLEVFSHNTAMELTNRGYQTTFLFGEDVDKDQVRRLVPAQDIFLWEGHYKTLTDEFGLPEWKEPLRPSLVFLQSCLALNEEITNPLFQRGAAGIVGSSSRIYSATGGTFTLAFFDAMLYDHLSLGGSLRQAKNFLLAYTLLKEKRLPNGAKLNGANLRSAWAFTLWGDPTLELPPPEAPPTAMPAVHTEVHGHTVTLTLPEKHYEPVTVEKYHTQMLPNARLAGLLAKDNGKDSQHLVPFLFTEVHLPNAPANKPLRVRSRLPDNHWVFTWDPRRRCGYFLITPRPRDQTEIRFFVDWEE